MTVLVRYGEFYGQHLRHRQLGIDKLQQNNHFPGPGVEKYVSTADTTLQQNCVTQSCSSAAGNRDYLQRFVSLPRSKLGSIQLSSLKIDKH